MNHTAFVVFPCFAQKPALLGQPLWVSQAYDLPWWPSAMRSAQRQMAMTKVVARGAARGGGSAADAWWGVVLTFGEWPSYRGVTANEVKTGGLHVAAPWTTAQRAAARLRQCQGPAASGRRSRPILCDLAVRRPVRCMYSVCRSLIDL